MGKWDSEDELGRSARVNQVMKAQRVGDGDAVAEAEPTFASGWQALRLTVLESSEGW